MPYPLTDENDVIRTIKRTVCMFNGPDGQRQLHGYGPEQRSILIHSACGHALAARFGRTAVQVEARVKLRASGPNPGGARIDFLLAGLRTAVELELGTLKRLPTILWKASMDHRVDRLVVVCSGDYVVGENGQGARQAFPRAVPRAQPENEGYAYAERGFPVQIMRFACDLRIIPAGVRVVRLDRFEPEAQLV